MSNPFSPLAAAPNLTRVSLGELRIPSGRLEACDPYVNLGQGAVVRVPPGTYPVSVIVAEVEPGHTREAALVVALATAEPMRTVLFQDDGPVPFDPEARTLAVSVDAGTVAFVDADAVAAGMPPDSSDWYDAVFDSGGPSSWFALQDSPDHLIEGSANITLPAAPHGENIVLAHSGWGDGVYQLVGTEDAEGHLASVAIDLGVAPLAVPGS
jgi:hypothetical protein